MGPLERGKTIRDSRMRQVEKKTKGEGPTKAAREMGRQAAGTCESYPEIERLQFGKGSIRKTMSTTKPEKKRSWSRRRKNDRTSTSTMRVSSRGTQREQRGRSSAERRRRLKNLRAQRCRNRLEGGKKLRRQNTEGIP